jgi:Tol biopolymer transport system component
MSQRRRRFAQAPPILSIVRAKRNKNMMSLVSRSRCALCLLPLVLAIGCQPVREDRSINPSKDGNQFAFQNGNEGVYIANNNGGSPIKIFQPSPGTVATSAPLWSPTDKRLIFTTAQKVDDKTKQLHLGGDGDPAGKLHFEAKTLYTCWLRDEEKDGKVTEPIAIFHAVCDHPGYVAANLAVRWSPDGKHLLFVEQTGEHEHAVFEFDLQTKKSRQVCKQAAEAIVFDWAPDGTHLVCVLGSKTQPRDTDGIWIGTPNKDDWWQIPESKILAKGELPAVLEKLRATRPTWSHDGKRFVFCTSETQDEMKKQYLHRLFLGTLSTHMIEKLAESTQPLRDLHWSPNGERLGYITGADEGPLTFIRIADKKTSMLVSNASAFIGWDEKNKSLSYVTVEPIPNSENATWVFLLTPNQRSRDAVWLAPADGSSRGEKVFSGVQVTFPQWSPKDAKLSLWATFNPSYRSWSSALLEFLTIAAKIDEQTGKSTSININGLRVGPGDPALLLNPENGALDWKATNPHEQMQVGHYYLLKREYAKAWEWYEKANKNAKPEDVRASLFFQYYCLTKLHRDSEAKKKLAQFERDFWPQLPEVVAPSIPNILGGSALSTAWKDAQKANGPTAAEMVRLLADPKALQGALLQDLYIAEVFLSLDVLEDGETYFRNALKNATTDAVRLNKAVMLSQFLLLAKKHREYLDLVNATLLPLMVSQDAFPIVTAAAAEKDANPLTQLSSFTGRHLALLPLCDPEFLGSLSREETLTLLTRLEDLRQKAGNDTQRLWLDVMAHAGKASGAAKRIADNPAILDARHGKNVAALIAEMRQSAAQMEELRKAMQFVQ